MKWLTRLEYYNIPFSIHILQTEDSIIISNIIKKHKIIYILDGFMHLLKIFTNGEKICTQLIYKNYVIQNQIMHKARQHNYYYKAIAITKTVIIIIAENILNVKIQKECAFFKEFQKLANRKNHDINQILVYKSTKKRILQLLLTVSKNFGKLKKGHILIPFYLPHTTIATIVGSQRVTVNKIMNKLKQNRIIYYNQNQVLIYNITKLTEE